MSYLSFVDYKNQTWSYVFINPDVFGVSDRDRTHLMWNIIDIHMRKEEIRDIIGEDYAGRIKRGKHSLIGSLSGILFNAELDTPKGKRKPEIMLLKKINAGLN